MHRAEQPGDVPRAHKTDAVPRRTWSRWNLSGGFIMPGETGGLVATLISPLIFRWNGSRRTTKARRRNQPKRPRKKTLIFSVSSNQLRLIIPFDSKKSRPSGGTSPPEITFAPKKYSGLDARRRTQRPPANPKPKDSHDLPFLRFRRSARSCPLPLRPRQNFGQLDGTDWESPVDYLLSDLPCRRTVLYLLIGGKCCCKGE